jgi:hypothetical protein
MNDWDKINYYYQRVVIGFIMFNCHEYSRCCILHLIHLNYWESHQPELYQLITSEYSAFDEECGEISLSVLARTTISKPIHNNIQSMSKYYMLQSFDKDENKKNNYFKVQSSQILKLVCSLLLLVAIISQTCI